ncbi:MAG: glycosyltransferase [Candidatus Thorarchaeota archaeon]
MRDRKYIHVFKKFKDPETIKLEDLKELPLVNIIIPAWKEGNLFKECLMSVSNLTYPNLKVIVNAGGSDETSKIANSFKKDIRFLILEQKLSGKIRALNECLEHIDEGIVYSIDADVFLTDEVLLRLIYPIININEFVSCGGVKPLQFQQNKGIVRYILLNRLYYFKNKFSRYGRYHISGPNTCFKYDVIRTIKKFSEENLYLESDRFRGPLILSKGYKIYWLNHYNSMIYTFFPDNLITYFKQEIRWRKNLLFDPMEKHKKLTIFKFILLIIYSFFIISAPVFLLLNYFLFVSIGFILFLNKYLNKIRRYIFFKNTMNERIDQKFEFSFFMKLFLYVYMDAVLTLILVPASLRSIFEIKRS